MNFARVIIDISTEAIDRAFTYRIPEVLKEELKPGMRVFVPFGNGDTQRKAYVIDLCEETSLEPDKIKEIKDIDRNSTSATGELIELAVFMAKEYGSTLNQALLTALPVKKNVRRNSRRTDPVVRMEDSGSFLVHDEELTVLQKKAVEEILSDQDAPALLYGVTGSGKTRVYIEMIRRMQEEGKQTIVLIPEISLTYQTVNELTAHLGNRVAILHSKLTEGEKYEQYRRCTEGDIDVMVGPRSAVFAPFERLGCIIIDEEHEKAYQSDTSPRYDAREVALKRCKAAHAKLILGSATPSIESYKKAMDGEYRLSVLGERAVKGSELPEIVIADMRKELEDGNKTEFSAELYRRITECLERKEQVMLFLNRRGYAGFVSCRRCGNVIKCPHCDVSMTAHNSWYYDRKDGDRKAALLSCHYCGYKASMPAKCPSCGSGLIAPFGTGTQKLELAVKRNFPQAKVLRMDADTTAAKDGHEHILSEFRKGNADILVGTQMIVKGHDFPNVTLVGIVAADASINIPDYSAAERTFQLLVQASGRAGRSKKAGSVVIQSYEPEHYAIQMAANGNYEAFYERELSFRHLMGYPPEIGFLTIKIISEDEGLLKQSADMIAGTVFETGKYVGAIVIGPCNASVYKVKDVYRKLIYVKHRNREQLIRLREKACEVLAQNFGSKKIYLNFDIK